MTINATNARIVFPAPRAIWATKPKFSHTHLGNAERLVEKYGSDIRYCHAWKNWLVWDDIRWTLATNGEVQRMAMLTVRSIGKEAKSVADDELRSKIEGFAKRSESRDNLGAMVDVAKNMSGVSVLPEQFDADPFLFNCLNGTLDLKTGALRPHDRENLITKLSPIEYRSDAECPIWQSFLHRILDGDAALIDFVQRAIGYSLTGAVTEKALFFLHGRGDNGKTTLIEAVRSIMGDYAGPVDIEALMKKASTPEKERATADLAGKRFATSSEAAQGDALHEARIKHLTGMGRLTGRRIYGSAFEFVPQFKLFIDANHKPQVSGTDDAIWNRFRLIPFTVSIPKAEQDRQLLAKLAAEAPGILAWAVQGCLRWQEEGLGAPATVTQATEDYRQEMDPVMDFIEDCCNVNAEAFTLSKDLYGAYCNWCKSVREEPISDKSFGLALERNGYSKGRKSGGARGRNGLELRFAERHRDQQDTAYTA